MTDELQRIMQEMAHKFTHDVQGVSQSVLSPRGCYEVDFTACHDLLKKQIEDERAASFEAYSRLDGVNIMLNEKVEKLEAQVGKLNGRFSTLRSLYQNTLEQMTDLNVHLCYPFTQIVMSHKERFRDFDNEYFADKEQK